MAVKPQGTVSTTPFNCSTISVNYGLLSLFGQLEDYKPIMHSFRLPLSMANGIIIYVSSIAD